MHPENLRKGMLVAIIGYKDSEPDTVDGYPIYYPPKRKPASEFDGYPLEILAVSPPFICVTNGSQTFAIDLRQYNITLVSQQYTDAMVEAEPTSRRRGSKRLGKKRIRTKPEKLDPKSYCPRCRSRFVQTMNERDLAWFLICKDCGFNGGPVTKE